MQDLLSQLSTPLAIALIIAGILALVGVVYMARRRRRQAPPDQASESAVGGPIDYTSIPLDDEPQSFRDRFNNLSLAGKILAVLVPILGLLVLIVLVTLLMPEAPEPQVLLPTPVPLSLSFASEPAVIRIDPSQAIGLTVLTTGMDDGTELTVQMIEDGAPFDWLNPEFTTITVRRNRAEAQIPARENAPSPVEGRTYGLVVNGPEGLTTNAALLVPSIYTEAFYGGAAAASAPTATPQPTATPEPTPEPGQTPEPTPEPTPDTTLPTGAPASVGNGGNVRALPFITADNVVGGVNAGEQVQLIARTPNGEWYRVRTIRDELGWVSASLLVIDPTTAAAVAEASVVTVFENGAVFEQPDLASTQIERVNVSEVVELLRKTADGTWYEVRNVRNASGWVPASLLGIPDSVAAVVPIAE